MYKVYLIALIGLLLIGCKEKTTKKVITEKKIEFNQKLVDELSKMRVIDQLAASNAYAPESYSYLTQEEWRSFKDSIYSTHQKRLDEIFEKFGFPGYDLVGKQGSNDFWLMTQHSDHNPEFQKEVLEKMKIKVDNRNANASNYGLLVDRVKINTGQKQVYGTQVAYNFKICQAYPKNLADSATVNKRRKSIGLEPIEIYLNDMSKMHFEMNKKFYSDKGITKPKLYTIE